MTRNELAVITAIDDNVIDLLGWTPDQLIGRASTELMHPEDQASGVAAWVTMATTPGSTGTWRGRYRTAGGTWEWVETTNRLDLDRSAVLTSMTAVTVAQVDVEEQLRARTEVLTRLSDALPVGLFQIDAARRVTFTNDRLHEIVGVPPAATVDAQMVTIVDADRPRFDSAVSAVLAGQPDDDIEMHLRDLSTGVERICLLNLRALTDGAGAVSGAIVLVTDVTDRVQLRRELEIRASVDQLTSCLNRSAILEVLDRHLANQNTTTEGLAVVFIDLDRFKAINDRFGHAAGDRLLTAAAERLRVAVRPCDSIGRLGGDEFLVVCPHVASPTAAVALAQRIESLLHHRMDVGPAIVDLHASVGVAWTSEPLDRDVLIARADSAMYHSKSNPHGGITLDAHASPR